MDIDEFISCERKRGDSYRLLSACFYPPKKELYIEENLFENLSMLLKTVAQDAVIFSTEMGKVIQNYSDEDLAVEYAKLFMGPYEIKAAPYGSVYLDQGRRVMGNSTMEVIKIYQEEGLSMDQEFKELPDHIAVELEFMNYIIYKEIDAYAKSKIEDVRKGLQNQEIFMRKFLWTWVPDFTKAIIENSNNHFYTNLAKCTEAFIKADMDYISKAYKKYFESKHSSDCPP